MAKVSEMVECPACESLVVIRCSWCGVAWHPTELSNGPAMLASCICAKKGFPVAIRVDEGAP